MPIFSEGWQKQRLPFALSVFRFEILARKSLKFELLELDIADRAPIGSFGQRLRFGARYLNR